MAFLLNGEHISNERLYREFLLLSGGRTPEQVQQQPGVDIRRLQEDAERSAVRSALLLQFARQEKLAVTPEEVEAERRAAWGSAANQSCGAGVTDDMAERALLRKVERHLTRHVQRPGRQELEAMYRANSRAFTLPERWLVAHIVRLAENGGEREAAREVLAVVARELAAGKPFAAMADKYSNCKGNAGSLGWITRGSMAPDFEEKVFSLAVKQPSEIFETVFGLHIAVVWDHKTEGVQPFDDVRADLARQILEERRQAVLHQTVDNLYRSASLQVVDEPERNVAKSERVS